MWVFIQYHLKSSIFNPLDEVGEKIIHLEKLFPPQKPKKSPFENILKVLDISENQLGYLAKDLENTKDHVEKLNEIIARSRKESEHLHRLASVGMITSGISHEIGNPLGAISAYVNSLSDAAISQKDKEDYCQNILGEIRRIEKIIKKVLHFSKFKEENEEILDLHGLVDEAVELCSYHKNFKKIELEKDLDRDPVFASFRKNQLLQVFVNITNNALDAMPKGWNHHS